MIYCVLDDGADLDCVLGFHLCDYRTTIILTTIIIIIIWLSCLR